MRFLIIIFLLSFSFFSSGQTSEREVVTIKTFDNKIFIGQLNNISADSITIENDSLVIITLSRTTVSNLYYKDLSANRSNVGDPFFIPTAIPNGRNNHYYKNYALLGQNFSFGVNDHLDISFGFELLSIFLNNDTVWPVAHLGAKYSGSVTNNMHIGISTKALFNDKGGVIINSVPITFGDLRTNFTFAPTFSQEIGRSTRDFVALVNFNVAMSEKIRLVTDCLYSDGTFIGTTLFELRLKSNILLLPGFIFSNEFQIIPNFSISLPFSYSKRKKT